MHQFPLLKSKDRMEHNGEGVKVLHSTRAERWTSWSDGVEIPVLTQPGLGVTTTTVTTITQTGGDWSTGLLDVCEDVGTCSVGMCMPCCLEVSLAHQYGECLFLPLLPASTFAMRVAIRERFKIRGSVCEDWVMVFCCYPLAVCQMMREMKRRLKRQTYTVTTALESSSEDRRQRTETEERDSVRRHEEVPDRKRTLNGGIINHQVTGCTV